MQPSHWFKSLYIAAFGNTKVRNVYSIVPIVWIVCLRKIKPMEPKYQGSQMLGESRGARGNVFLGDFCVGSA